MSDSEGSDFEGFTNEDIQDAIDRADDINLEDFPNGEDFSAEEDKGAGGDAGPSASSAPAQAVAAASRWTRTLTDVFGSDTGPYSHS